MPDGRFPTTQWTLVARLKSGDEKESRRALDQICTAYHHPLYCYIRKRGLNHHDAADALHDFLARLLRLGSLKMADAEKGRLRSYLCTALQHFLSSRHRGARQQPRNVSLDDSAEELFRHEQLADHLTPESTLEKTWATNLLRLSLQDLAEAESTAGRGAQFQMLEPFLSPDAVPPDYAVLVPQCGKTAEALRKSVQRLRQSFRKILRSRIAETLEEPSAEQIDEELNALQAAMRI
ncbi:hypothetical protein [Prosthecobacter sp.]|uniref:hypothetical protein n=1 Tax=Prosthecobacter sp. TaxID=1965333 RepID=UPI003784C986